MMTSANLYAKGYAIQVYGIAKDIQHWVFKDESYTTKQIEVTQYNGLPVAPIELVRQSATK